MRPLLLEMGWVGIIASLSPVWGDNRHFRPAPSGVGPTGGDPVGVVDEIFLNFFYKESQ